ncbi:MAG: hypothetical protein ACO20F_08685 [Robiginitalea sp.]
MKAKLIFLNLFAVLLVAVSCDSNDDPADTLADVNPAELRSAAQNGQWRITYYFDSDKEETSDYAGYVFTFGADGTVTATNGTTEVTGTWSVTDSSSSDDDSFDDSSDVDFNLFFASPPNFEELTDDWDILEYSASRIRLIDVSGGDGSTDYLTFDKI